MSRCILWAGKITSGGASGGGGYGYTIIQGRHRYAHRLAWESERGPIPAGMCIDHLCRNRACVNVEHMEVVTRGENVMRGESLWAKYGRASNCINGHAWTPENTYVRKDTGTRQCITCHNARRRASRAAVNRDRMAEELSKPVS